MAIRAPVVRRADRHDVDILAIQQLAIVFVDRRLGGFQALPQALGVGTVDVAEGHDVAVAGGRGRVAAAHPAVADTADGVAIVLRPRLVIGGHALGGEEIGSGQSRRGQSGRVLQEMTA